MPTVSTEITTQATAAVVWPDLMRCSPALHVWVTRPDTATAVIGTSGDLDSATAAEFNQILARELDDSVSLVVFDLSELGFLGAAGLHLLMQAKQRAESTVRLVTGPRCVDRALDATGLRGHFDCYPNQRAALGASG